MKENQLYTISKNDITSNYKMRNKFFIIFLVISLMSSCYVSNTKTATKKDFPKTGNLFLVSKMDNRNNKYIKDLCDDLSRRFNEIGYYVEVYVPENYDSLYFSNVLETRNPNLVVFIVPKSLYAISSTGFIEVNYSVELFSRQNSRVNRIYTYNMRIAYRDDLRNMIIRKASDEIYAIFKQE